MKKTEELESIGDVYTGAYTKRRKTIYSTSSSLNTFKQNVKEFIRKDDERRVFETNEILSQKKRRMAGITLIALVITIIVILLLAGVSISMISGNNGILTKVGEASEAQKDAVEEEQVKMAVVTAIASDSFGKLTNANLRDAIKNEFGSYDGLAGTGPWTYTGERNIYNIDGDGNVSKTDGSINWDKILADATENPDNYKHPEQSTTNGDIGIGTDGNPVNLDLWTYEVINGNEIQLFKWGSCVWTPGYQNSNIVDGKIIGEVPQYIKISGNSDFNIVTSMQYTFSGCTGLTTAPKIPSSVTKMSETFDGCTGLTTAPTIPEGVTHMNYTFYNCKSLTTAPEIPSSVTNMNYTFYNCGSLTTAPEIPSSVTDMYSTFSGCTGLTTAPTIPDSVTNMESTFSGCTGLTTAPEIPSSVTEMISTFSGCTGLTTAPEIPSSVTRMSSTFSGCTGLTTAPEIPSSVTFMGSTFSGCTGLTTAPTIPSSVEYMRYTFEGCTKLQGIIEINANPTYYRDCFLDAATEGTGLVLTGTSTMLETLMGTKGTNSNITIAE